MTSRIIKWLKSITYLQKIIILAIILGIIFTIGLIFAQSREERFTSLYIFPDSYNTYPNSESTSFVYGIKSFERKRISYELRVFLGNRLMNVTQFALEPGETVQKGMVLNIKDAILPTKVSLILKSQYDTYEVHYWLKETLPVAAFFANLTSGKEPLEVHFKDLSTNKPTEWLWKFGDGTTSHEQNPSHTYSAGSFTVTLAVSNSGGNDEATKDTYIIVEPKTPPVASFYGDPVNGKPPLNVTFTDLSTNNPTKWEWEFGDLIKSSDKNPSHAYIKPGNYTVRLISSNTDGSDELIKDNYINVYPLITPVASFYAEITSGMEPLTVQFTDTSLNGPTSWMWDFGDGTTSTLQNPVHTYTGGDSYTVRLTVSNADGSDQAIHVGYIDVFSNPQPIL
jgi:PKD repeat protein